MTPAPEARFSPWQHEFQKFLKQDVTVTYELGAITKSVTGKFVGYSPQGFHCLIDTPTECVFVRLPLEIRRARKHGQAKSAEGSAV